MATSEPDSRHELRPVAGNFLHTTEQAYDRGTFWRKTEEKEKAVSIGVLRTLTARGQISLAALHSMREWLAAKGSRELWQDGKHSLPLYSPHWLAEKINYIHWNPVRKGLAETPANYPWSSFNAYQPDSNIPPIVPVNLDWEKFFDE